MSKERSHILRDVETDCAKITSKTNVFSVDLMLDFFIRRACEENIHFDISLAGDVKYLVSNVITEQDFNTILSDLLENAFIATEGMEVRNVLLVIGINESYYFSVFDNGYPFDSAVIAHIGKNRYTTRKACGGSGIGLMTVCELLELYKASLEIRELTSNTLYSKQVSVCFDSLSQIRITSARPEIGVVCNTRSDLTFTTI